MVWNALGGMGASPMCLIKKDTGEAPVPQSSSRISLLIPDLPDDPINPFNYLCKSVPICGNIFIRSAAATA
jgi:hypothetical protein